MTMTKDDILTAIKDMSVMDLADLVKELEDAFGVSAAAPMMAAMPGAGGPGVNGDEAAEEKTEFTVTLKEFGANKIKVIKAVREITPLGLKEAKELVESAPTVVKEDVPQEEANEAKEKLEGAGATVEVG